MIPRLRLLLFLILFGTPSAVLAAPAPFDLAGPKLEVRVTHAGVTLPISQTPNLSPGDQLVIKADLPAGQSVHYLLVSAFLRGATNPPPETWFASSQTWNRKAADGLKIVVPPDAQQLLLFLAPETGGDFKAVVNAVRGRPGAFVRASQDLNQASLDRSRLDAFLAAVRRTDQADPEVLKTTSPLLARSLLIKLDANCLQKTPELRAACLTQGQDSLVMNDGQSTSMVQALTSGYSADLVQQLGATPRGGSGYYSPYIGSALDIARILDSFHTAQYQYIPAITTMSGEQLSLLLNTAPSFQNPKSVLVLAMPAIEPAQVPPLHAVNPGEVYCAQRPGLVLPVEGAPLAFSTGYAHAMVLRLKGKDGQWIDLPARADAERGGFQVDTAGLDPANLDGIVDGALHGLWGFEAYDGPEFHFQIAHPQAWRMVGDDEKSLIVGRDEAVRLQAPAAACIQSVALQQASGPSQPIIWKSDRYDEVTATLPLKAATAGPLTVLIQQYGLQQADAVSLQAFAHASDLDSFTIHAGDASGVLKGARLEEVKTLKLAGVDFLPAPGATNANELVMVADPQAAAKLKSGQSLVAKVALGDGRAISLALSVKPPRPRVVLMDKSVQPAAQTTPDAIQLADKNELPRDARLTFSIRAQAPTSFTGKDRLDIAGADGEILATLTAAGGGLTLEDSQVALATLDTGKAFGASVFGPLRFRVADDSAAGDWQPLATLVRLPQRLGLTCPAAASQPCVLTGSSLFLIGSLAPDAAFAQPVVVPEGFPGDSLPVPRPQDGKLYVKLRDAPSVVNLAVLPLQTATASEAGGGTP